MKRVTLFTKTGCSTCIKAKQHLIQQGIHFTERDIFKHPLSETELQGLGAWRPLREIFSHRSPSVKALGLPDRELAEAELVAVMGREPRAIRRPLVAAGERLVVGYNAVELDAALCEAGFALSAVGPTVESRA